MERQRKCRDCPAIIPPHLQRCDACRVRRQRETNALAQANRTLRYRTDPDFRQQKLLYARQYVKNHKDVVLTYKKLWMRIRRELEKPEPNELLIVGWRREIDAVRRHSKTPVVAAVKPKRKKRLLYRDTPPGYRRCKNCAYRLMGESQCPRCAFKNNEPRT